MSPPEKWRRLSSAGLAKVPELLDAAEQADGVRPVSEQAELVLRHPRDSVVHIGVIGKDAKLLGYAQVDTSVLPATVEGAVHPAHRRAGIGALLRDGVKITAGRGGSLVWAHGGHPGARALAASSGAERVRELLQMRRLLSGPGAPELPPVDLPAGLRLRAFVPGQDEQAFLAVNAVAFRKHPEQGAWRWADLKARMGESWFDPAGFLLVEDEATGELLGFHWTKVHAAAPGRLAEGEVYVVGVHPGAQGRGVGGAATRAGLHHLATVRDDKDKPLGEVLLYVEASNETALKVYRGLGFEVAGVDEQYALGPPETTAAIVKA